MTKHLHHWRAVHVFRVVLVAGVALAAAAQSPDLGQSFRPVTDAMLQNPPAGRLAVLPSLTERMGLQPPRSDRRRHREKSARGLVGAGGGLRAHAPRARRRDVPAARRRRVRLTRCGNGQGAMEVRARSSERPPTRRHQAQHCDLSGAPDRYLERWIGVRRRRAHRQAGVGGQDHGPGEHVERADHRRRQGDLRPRVRARQRARAAA